MTAYAELRLRIDRGVTRGSYRIVATGPAGEALGRFKLPFSELELENFILKVGSTRRGRRRIDSPEMDLAKTFGTKLFGALFEGDVRELYRSSFSESRAAGNGLRVTLSLTGAPELLQVPWEYLYDHPSFLSISTWTPIVRYLDLPKPRRPLRIELPLRILALVSAPVDAEPIDARLERTKLEGALAPLISMGAITVDWLEEASLRALQHRLRKADYHVFHYIGHGGYDEAADDGVLLFEDEHGRARRVSGVELGTILADEVSLRLAVLNSCEGARSSLQDPFSGVATSLIEREIPAVIGMQFEITDRAAIVFAGEFYSALADGLAVDSSVAEARKAIFADQNDIEWGTPVLFMRVADGRLFDVQAHAPIRAAEPEPPAAAAVAATAIDEAELAERERVERDTAETAARERAAAEAAEREAAERTAFELAAAAAAEAAERETVEAAERERLAAEAAAATEAAERDRVAGEAAAAAEHPTEAWVSEEELAAPGIVSGSRRSGTPVAEVSAGSAAASPTPETVPDRPRTVADLSADANRAASSIEPNMARAAGRAALGGVLTIALGDVWGLVTNLETADERVASSLESFLGLAALMAVALVAAVTLAEGLWPAVRVPDGSVYQRVGANRWAAAAIEGAVAGATVGFLVVVALYPQYIALETSLVVGVTGAIGFVIAEAVLSRLFGRRPGPSSHA
jgi:CHAT domain